MNFEMSDSIDKLIKDFSNSIIPTLNIEISEWRKSLNPWDTLVENCREYFKDEWGIRLISVIAAGIRSKDETYEEFGDLHDSSVSLCKRVRCARMKSGNIKYWESQLNNSNDLNFALLIFFAWSTAKTINHMLDKVDKLIDGLNEEEYLKLVDGLEQVSRLSTFSSSQRKLIEKKIASKNISDELIFVISLRVSKEYRGRFIHKKIKKVNKKLEKTSNIRMEYIINEYLNDSSNSSLLDEIKNLFPTITKDDEPYYYRRQYFHRSKRIPILIAKTIMEDSRNYPKVITYMAEMSCRLFANENIKPVGEIANNEKWFK